MLEKLEKILPLQEVSKELQNDKDIVMAAVKHSGNALEYASKNLKNDKEVVLEAVKSDERAMVFASKNLKSDKDIKSVIS